MTLLRQCARGSAWVLSGVLVGVPLLGVGGPLGPDLALAGAGLQISGDIGGLRPGLPGDLVLTISNTGAGAGLVLHLAAEVTDVSGDCPAAALAITPWAGRVEVPAGGSVTQSLRVLLDPDAGCGDATWQLRYEAR